MIRFAYLYWYLFWSVNIKQAPPKKTIPPTVIVSKEKSNFHYSPWQLDKALTRVLFSADLEFSSQRIKATESSCALYRLLPNTTYYFRIAAVNRWVTFVSLLVQVIQLLSWLSSPPLSDYTTIAISMAIFATLIKTASLDRLGQGEFVSLMGKTRPLVKSLGMVTYEEEDTGYGRCLLILFWCASKFLHCK